MSNDDQLTTHVVLVSRPNPDLPMPRRVHSTDAGSDLICLENTTLKPMETKAIPINMQIAIPEGHFGRVCGRSGLSSQGLLIHPGTIDVGYTGVVKAIATNLSLRDMLLEAGARIAQIIILPIYVFELKEVSELPAGVRGNKGFGDSGK